MENLVLEKPSHGGLDEKLGETIVATPIPYPKSPMEKQHPNHDLFEKVKFISPFVSHSCEMEHPAPSLELKQRPFGQPNSYATDISKTPTLETEENDSTIEHESFSSETPHVSCSRLESPEFIVLSAACCYEEDNHPSLLVSKLFRRMAVDVFVYHKHCKFHSSTVVLTLQLEH